MNNNLTINISEDYLKKDIAYVKVSTIIADILELSSHYQEINVIIMNKFYKNILFNYFEGNSKIIFKEYKNNADDNDIVLNICELYEKNINIYDYLRIHKKDTLYSLIEESLSSKKMIEMIQLAGFEISNKSFDKSRPLGLGDILWGFVFLKNNLIDYLNINIATFLIYENYVNYLDFRIKLIKDLCKYNNIPNDKIIFYFDIRNDKYLAQQYDNETYSRAQNYKLDFFEKSTENKEEKKIINFHTKSRIYRGINNCDKNIEIYSNFLSYLKISDIYNVNILGEKKIPEDNFEVKLSPVKIISIYNYLLNLEKNNSINDLTNEYCIDNLNYENFLKDLQLIQNAEYNIIFGSGGPLCFSMIFGEKTIVFCEDLYQEYKFKYNILKSNQVTNVTNMYNFIKFIENNISDKTIVPRNYLTQHKTEKNAYFVGHNGLGDNISNLSALSYLSNFYNKIFFICKDIYFNNVKILLSDIENIEIVPINSKDEVNNIKIIYNDVIHNSDFFVSGFFHKKYIQSKITNTFLNSYKPDLSENDNFYCNFKHVVDFYLDINLDLSIYYGFFNLPSFNKSLELYDSIKKYKICLTHQETSMEKLFNAEELLNLSDDYIIIDINDNYYEKTKEINSIKYELAQQFVNIEIVYYKDTILNCDKIYISDSCLSCIVYPLFKANKLSTEDVTIIERHTKNKAVIAEKSKNKYFLTYNDQSGIYNDDTEKLIDSVDNFSDFQTIIFPKKKIDIGFYRRFKSIFDKPRGGGYWLWKPYIIFFQLNKLAENDVLFYLDSKYYFVENFESLYLDKLSQSDIVVWKNKPNEDVTYLKNYCKMDVIRKYKMGDLVFNKSCESCWGGAIVIKKTKLSLQIIKEWLQMCCFENDITDTPSVSPNLKTYIEHRHDQSLLSIVLHKYNIPFHNFEKKYLQNVRVPW